MNKEKNLVEKIISILDDKKAENIQNFDLKGKDYITDHVVIATALVGKHSYALLDALKSELKPLGVTFYGTDELSEDWVIADLGSVMVHIFTQNHRDKFNLEEFFATFKRQNI